MCVNKDLLDKKVSRFQRKARPLEEFDLQKLTKDTNGDRQLDQFGSTEYTWKEALAIWKSSLQGGMLKLTAPEVKRVFDFSAKIGRSNKNYKVSSKDFDQGKSPSIP